MTAGLTQRESPDSAAESAFGRGCELSHRERLAMKVLRSAVLREIEIAQLDCWMKALAGVAHLELG
jgi:hypothetical protein